MSIAAPAFYRDEFGIGQVRIAVIRREAAEAELAECAPPAFCLGYENPGIRASFRRRFAAARAEYERATTILNAMGANQ